MRSGSGDWARARLMADVEEVRVVVPEADPVGLVLEEEVRAAVVRAAEEGVGVVDVVAEEVGAEIKMGAAVLTTGSSRASATGGVNRLRTRVLFLSRFKIRH